MPSFIFLPDIHVGEDLQYNLKTSSFVKKPTHDVKFISSVFEFIKEFKPTHIILGGDQFDFSSLSRFNAKSTIDPIEGELTRTYKIFEELILIPAMSSSLVVWLQGNHDDRVVELVRKYPQLASLVEPWEYLKLKSQLCKDHLKNRGELFNLGKLWFTHGDNISGSGDIAKSAREYNRNLRFGHFHTYRAYTLHSPVDAKDVKTCIAVPSVCGRAPSWGKNKPNQWLQGFCYGNVTAKGNFYDQIVVRTPEGFKAEGKIYKC